MASDATVPSKYITLISCDGFEFVVLRQAVQISSVMKGMLDPRSECFFLSKSGLDVYFNLFGSSSNCLFFFSHHRPVYGVADHPRDLPGNNVSFSQWLLHPKYPVFTLGILRPVCRTGIGMMITQIFRCVLTDGPTFVFGPLDTQLHLI